MFFEKCWIRDEEEDDDKVFQFKKKFERKGMKTTISF